MTDIVERLRRTYEYKVDADELRIAEIGGAALVYRNPDGPEAADTIIRLQQEVERLREALTAIDQTTFIGVSTLFDATRQVALESAHDIASSALQPEGGV